MDPDTPAVFRVADALRAGVPRRAIDSPEFDRPFTGLRALPPSTADEDPAAHPAEPERRRVRRQAQLFAAHMHEYEGDHHRLDARQSNRDIAKYDRLAELGWRVIRVTKAMAFEDPGALTSRVRAALVARG